MNEVNCTSIFEVKISGAMRSAYFTYDSPELWRTRFWFPLQSAEGKGQGQERHQG